MAASALPRRTPKKLVVHEGGTGRQEERPTLLRHRGPRYGGVVMPEPEAGAEPQDCGGEASPAARPAYAHGAVVECYSQALRKWVRGEAAILVQDAPEEGSPPLVSYEVGTGRPRQPLRNVKLEEMREPLQTGESVEVLTAPGGDGWSQGAVTAEHRSAGPSPVVSYRVRVGQGDAAFEISGVEPERLRRHFPPGAAVDVYRGPQHGWAPAVVRSPAGVQPEREPHVRCVSVLLVGSGCACSDPSPSSWESVPVHLVRPRRHRKG